MCMMEMFKIKQELKNKNFIKPQHHPATAENIIGP